MIRNAPTKFPRCFTTELFYGYIVFLAEYYELSYKHALHGCKPSNLIRRRDLVSRKLDLGKKERCTVCSKSSLLRTAHENDAIEAIYFRIENPLRFFQAHCPRFHPSLVMKPNFAVFNFSSSHDNCRCVSN